MEENEYKNLNVSSDGLSRKKRMSWAVPIAIVAVLALAGVSIWGYYQNRQLKDLKIMMENQYSRAFLDLNEYVDNLQVLLAKSLVTSTPKGTSVMLEEVWRQANLAQTNMGQLPVAPPILEKTSNFLTQVGDMAYAYNTKTMNGLPLSDDEYSMLEKMHGYALSLQKSLHGIEEQINNGKMSWGAVGGMQQLKSQNKKNIQTTQFDNIEKNFQEYPSMIYDGPYSDHMMKVKPVGLKDKTVSVKEAEQIVRKMIGNDKIKSIKRLEDNKEDSIETYRFKVYYNNSDDDGSAQVDITKKGGQIYWMLRNRSLDGVKISMEDAIKSAKTYLTKNGFSNMTDTYYMKTDGFATVCFAYEQDGVTVYPDLVKVKVALDNGEILGIEAKGYLYNHKKRDIPKTSLTLEQARSKINSKLKIEKQGRAIIPTDYKTEIYCYEFQGTLDSQKFLLYINAETGVEEDILLLVSTDEGTLTM